MTTTKWAMPSCCASTWPACPSTKRSKPESWGCTARRTACCPGSRGRANSWNPRRTGTGRRVPVARRKRIRRPRRPKRKRSATSGGGSSKCSSTKWCDRLGTAASRSIGYWTAGSSTYGTKAGWPLTCFRLCSAGGSSRTATTACGWRWNESTRRPCPTSSTSTCVRAGVGGGDDPLLLLLLHHPLVKATKTKKTRRRSNSSWISGGLVSSRSWWRTRTTGNRGRGVNGPPRRSTSGRAAGTIAAGSRSTSTLATSAGTTGS